MSNITEKVLQVGETLQGKNRWMVFKAIDQRTLFDLVNNISIAWGDRERLGRVKLTITNVSNRHNLESIYTL